MPRRNQKPQYINNKFLLLIFLGFVFAGLMWWFTAGNWQILDPKGLVAKEQRTLIAYSVLLMLTIVLPIFGMTIFIARKYRADNHEKYTPDWDKNLELQFLWWALPTVIVFLLAILAWKSSHRLDPLQSIQGSTPPLTIQVVALDWKWLFIYPKQEIATVNYIQIPVNTPVKFELTADAPMNSFWIPQLGSQIYAMAGMKTTLHLMADTTGEYPGSAAEINGEGFAGMRFTAKAVTSENFNRWVSETKQTELLTAQKYDELAQPSHNHPQAAFRLADVSLFDQVIRKYSNHTH